MTVAKITDHVVQAKARMLSQYKGKPRFEGMIEAVTQDAQSLEETLFDMYYERSVNSAIGKQLDIIGNIVGQPRLGMLDDVYRIAILGKIGVNISNGVPEDLIALFKLLMKCTKAQYIPYYPAECAIFGNFAPVDSEQLLVDGNMEAPDTSAWQVVNNATLTKEGGGEQHGGQQCLRVAYNGSNNPGAGQTILAIGEWYWLRGWVKTDGVAGHIPVIYNGATILQAYVSFAGWYDFDVIFQATSQDLTLGTELSEAGWVEYDSCGCRRLLLNNLQDIYDMCLKVVPAGVKLIGIGWYNDDGHDDIWDGDDEDEGDGDDEGGDDGGNPLNKYFSFEGDPNGMGFGDLDDPTVGGKFASLFLI